MSKSNNSGGIGFIGLLAVLFIALKLTHVIAWSWWLILAPLWVPLLIMPIFFILMVWVVEK